jgi:ferritin
MVLGTEVQKAINEQINDELYSAYLYLSMSAYCDTSNLLGFAHWMRLQSQEELTHAMKLFDFVHDRGGQALLKAINQPPADFKSPLDVMEQALAHERQVSQMIHRLYEFATNEKDYATLAQLQWFLLEQVEEEKRASEIVQQIKLAGNQGPALLLLDRQLGSRTLSR